jgi:hypothetical protein
VVPAYLQRYRMRTAGNRPQRGRDLLDEAFYRLAQILPPRLRPALRWLRSNRSKPVRIPLGILCIVAAFFWFLPVVGLEFLPIGLLLLSQDVPFLRRPAARLTLWLIDGYERLQRAWRRWRKR